MGVEPWIPGEVTGAWTYNVPSLPWHSRLARRTYKSVLTKKCEGREFEPPREQGFNGLLAFTQTKIHTFMQQEPH